MAYICASIKKLKLYHEFYPPNATGLKAVLVVAV